MALDLSPPFEGAFTSYESLFSSLQEHAKAHGYAVAIGNSRRDRAGILSTQYIHCVKASDVNGLDRIGFGSTST